MVSTNWTTSFQLRMVLLKKKWQPFKLVFSMSPSILSKFLLTLALDFRAGSSKPIPHDWINQGGELWSKPLVHMLSGQPINAEVRLLCHKFSHSHHNVSQPIPTPQYVGNKNHLL